MEIGRELKLLYSFIGFSERIVVAMSSDYKTILKLKSKSEKTFKKVYYQYNKLVYYHAYNIINNKEDAEDVMQNIFIKLMKNIYAIDDDAYLNTTKIEFFNKFETKYAKEIEASKQRLIEYKKSLKENKNSI